MANNDKEQLQKYLAMNMISKRMSYYSYYFTLLEMRAQGLDGLPYIDCKTFKGWKDYGFKVKKGEHSKIKGITWIFGLRKNEEGEEENMPLYPKMYKLFHKTQVEPC